jgi:heat shock protein HslJ
MNVLKSNVLKSNALRNHAMMRISGLVLVLALGLPAQAQSRFPVDKSYKAVSISGFDVQNKGLSMTVSGDPKGDLRGSGNAGCNSWNATVILRDEQLDFTNIVTTRKLCAKPTMKAEEAFLTSLRSAKRWRIDGDKLIIEGDAARLMLRPGVAELKPDKRPAKRPRPAR